MALGRSSGVHTPRGGRGEEKEDRDEREKKMKTANTNKRKELTSYSAVTEGKNTNQNKKRRHFCSSSSSSFSPFFCSSSSLDSSVESALHLLPEEPLAKYQNPSSSSSSSSSASSSSLPPLTSLSLLTLDASSPSCASSSSSKCESSLSSSSSLFFRHLDAGIDKSLLCFRSQRFLPSQTPTRRAKDDASLDSSTQEKEIHQGSSNLHSEILPEEKKGERENEENCSNPSASLPPHEINPSSSPPPSFSSTSLASSVKSIVPVASLDTTAVPGEICFHRVDLNPASVASMISQGRNSSFSSKRLHRETKKNKGPPDMSSCSSAHLSSPPLKTSLHQQEDVCSSSSSSSSSGVQDVLSSQKADLHAKKSSLLSLLPGRISASSSPSASVLQKQERSLRQEAKASSLSRWYEIPACDLSPHIRRELKLLELRGHVNPKTFHKEGLRIAIQERKKNASPHALKDKEYTQHTAYLHVCTVKQNGMKVSEAEARPEARGGYPSSSSFSLTSIGGAKRRGKNRKSTSLLTSLLNDEGVAHWTRKKVGELRDRTIAAKNQEASWKVMKKKRRR